MNLTALELNNAIKFLHVVYSLFNANILVKIKYSKFEIPIL